MANEAVLHWEGWVKVVHLAEPLPRVIIPMPWIGAVEGEIRSLGDMGWEFLRDVQDEDTEVWHYICHEPPWAPQIRSAMSQRGSGEGH